jgi:hypothetical protein
MATTSTSAVGSVDARPVEISDDLCLILTATGLLAKLRENYAGRRDSVDHSLDAIESAAEQLSRRIVFAVSGNPLPSTEVDPSLSKDDVFDSAGARLELGVSERRVRQLCGTGELPAQRIGRCWMIRHSDLEELKQRRSNA